MRFTSPRHTIQPVLYTVRYVPTYGLPCLVCFVTRSAMPLIPYITRLFLFSMHDKSRNTKVFKFISCFCLKSFTLMTLDDTNTDISDTSDKTLIYIPIEDYFFL